MLNPTVKFPIWQMCRLEDSYREMVNVLASFVDPSALQPYLNLSVKLCLQLRMLIVYLAYTMAILLMFPIFVMMVVDLVLYATKVLHLRADRKAPAPFQNKESQDSSIVAAEPIQLHKGSSLTSLSSLRSSTSIASSLNVPVAVTNYSPAIRASDIHRRIPRRAND